MAAAHESGWITAPGRGRHPFLTSLQIRERGWTREERVAALYAGTRITRYRVPLFIPVSLFSIF